MSEARISVRMDNNQKKQAEAVLSGDPIECRMQEAVKAKVSAVKSSGSPVALYDDLQNRPFLEYPDGSRVYDID